MFINTSSFQILDSVIDSNQSVHTCLFSIDLQRAFVIMQKIIDIFVMLYD